MDLGDSGTILYLYESNRLHKISLRGERYLQENRVSFKEGDAVS